MRVYAAEIGDRDGSKRVRELLAYGYHEMFGEKMPDIAKTDKGKPYFPQKPGIFFSLSHTDTHVLCVLGKEPVGGDIQTVRPVKERIIQRVCTKNELECFSFYQLWTLKESWIKLNGYLDRELLTVEFSGSPVRIVPPLPATSAKLYTIGECIAAVCTKDGMPPSEIIQVEL